VKISTPLSFDVHDANLENYLAALPTTSGVYVLQIAGNHPHLGSSANLPRRLKRLFAPSSAGSGSIIGRLRANLARIDCWPTGSKLENSLVLYELARLYFAEDYIRRLRLRMPWFVGLASDDPFARLAVVNRVSQNSGAFLGPFPSRDAAQLYEQETSGLFQIRRCTERLAPHSEHPGCIYGEMNQCLRPCQCAVTAQEYASEVARVGEFLSTNGRSTLAVLSAARDRACDETEFEQAAGIHKRIEKVKAATAARDQVITEIDLFNGVALTRAAQAGHFQLWPMLQGYWQEPVLLDFRPGEPRTKSLDQELRERLESALSIQNVKRKRTEDLAIFSRWYFSSWRDGEWFPFTTLAHLNYRRLVREISKMSRSVPENGVF